MEIKPIFPHDELWQRAIDYGKNCSWRAGPIFAKKLEQNKFLDWERVFLAIDENKIAGFCTFVKKDCIPELVYSPYISSIFVGEEYRGKRLSEKMILTVIEYARELKFSEIFIVSNHENFYEKYGYVKTDEKKYFWKKNESIFRREI